MSVHPRLYLITKWKDLVPTNVLLGFWLLTLAAIPVWAAFDTPGWDVAVYRNAIRALLAGRDPYADATAIQQLVHQTRGLTPGTDPPYSYVYSPITLPLLRIIGRVPTAVSGFMYWLAYGTGVLLEVWVGLCAAERHERRVFLYLAPLAAFFPGLLANGILLSGNVAYILYGLILASAIAAWKGRAWWWFYFAVLTASCLKAPLLSLLVIPVFSARRQWVPAGLTLLSGLVLFSIQPLLWPSLFQHYLQAVELQFSLNRDFGCSPAGLFAGFLFDHQLSYSRGSFLFFLGYALPILGVMLYLSRRFLRGHFSLQRWIPVLLLGTILLNPRLIEYDVAPLTIPLALIGWRFVSSLFPARKAALVLSLFLVVANVAGLYSWNLRKLVDGPLLVAFFLGGVWNLLRQPDATSNQQRDCVSLDPEHRLSSQTLAGA